jgi:hypothetical protein
MYSEPEKNHIHPDYRHFVVAITSLPEIDIHQRCVTSVLFSENERLRDTELIEYGLFGEIADEEKTAEFSAFSLKVSSETPEL